MQQRFLPLDIFRGATVALMILVNNPGSWEDIFPPLDHSPWNGCTPTDLVFPFFLFAVGNSLAFVIPKMREKGAGVFWQKTVTRSLLIFGIGLFLNWCPFVRWTGGHFVPKLWGQVRILGVLQRIAFCYLFAAVSIYYMRPKVLYVFSGLVLIGYWALCTLLGKHGDPFSLAGFYGTGLDKIIIGVSHLYTGEGVPFDPEGIGSLPAAVVHVILGYITGAFVRGKKGTPELINGLFVFGFSLMFVGYFWDMVFPINKKIWTSSFTVYTSGLANVLLGLIVFVVEKRGDKSAWVGFFTCFGKNPLFVFVMSGLVPRLLGLIKIKDGLEDNGNQAYISPLGWFYEHFCKHLVGDLRVGSLFYAVLMVLTYWGVARVLDKKGIYVKI